MVVELRLHGVHPEWIKWAVYERGDSTCQFMLDSLEGKEQVGASLISWWKKPMNHEHT
jgi:hypothetical protein